MCAQQRLQVNQMHTTSTTMHGTVNNTVRNVMQQRATTMAQRHEDEDNGKQTEFTAHEQNLATATLKELEQTCLTNDLNNHRVFCLELEHTSNCFMSHRCCLV